MTVSDMPKRSLATGEFVAMLALLISLAAMAIDAMLPAMPSIAKDLGVTGDNEIQYIVSVMFLGFGCGQILYGPLSDSFGRKPVIYAGVILFMLGCALSASATNFAVMLLGRGLQGLGAASPRIVSNAMIRDQHHGRAMARIMSIVMAVFIVVPALAPLIGTAILLFSHWRAIFLVLLLQALLAITWLALRQPETHPKKRRSPFSLSSILKNTKQVIRSPNAMGYAATSGFVFGGFMGYLMSAQQIFQELYDTRTLFPLYFGTLALSIGIASAINSKLVMRFGMRRLCYLALIGMCTASLAFTPLALMQHGQPPLWQFMTYMIPSFFCIGILFGNLNAMAMEPVGHIAGVGAAVIGFSSTLISLTAGTIIGQLYNQTIFPLLTGFATLSIVSLALVYWVESRNTTPPPETPRKD